MIGLALVAVWALAEAMLLFIVADVPISALALRGGWKAGWRAALAATVSAALGGLAVMAWARSDPGGCRAAMLALPAIGPALADAAALAWREGGWRAMLAGSFAGTPYKLYALAAGTQGSGMAGFFLASLAARLPRFIMIAAAFALIGRSLRPRLPARVLAAAFALGWAGFYAWYFAAMGAG